MPYTHVLIFKMLGCWCGGVFFFSKTPNTLQYFEGVFSQVLGWRGGLCFPKAQNTLQYFEGVFSQILGCRGMFFFRKRKTPYNIWGMFSHILGCWGGVPENAKYPTIFWGGSPPQGGFPPWGGDPPWALQALLACVGALRGGGSVASLNDL